MIKNTSFFWRGEGGGQCHLYIGRPIYIQKLLGSRVWQKQHLCPHSKEHLAEFLWGVFR